MLKTAFGKAIVGVVALSGVATHAVDIVRGGTLSVNPLGGKIDFSRDGWEKLPNQWSKFTPSAQGGIIFNPHYTFGLETSLELFASPFWAAKPQVTVEAKTSEDGTEATVEGRNYKPSHTFGGLVVKSNYALSESFKAFGQFGYGVFGNTEEYAHGAVVGAGVSYHIDGGFTWTILDYKHIMPLAGADTVSNFGTLSTGVKYNWL